MALQLLITDRDLVPATNPIGDWTDLQAVIPFNDTASGQFTAPADPEWLGAAGTPGNRVSLVDNGTWVTGGPIEHPAAWSWSATASDTSGGGLGQVTVSFAGDLVYLANRLTYPDPVHDAGAQTVTQYTATGNPQTLMRTLVDVNAGAGALAYRRIPHLVLGALASGVTGTAAITTAFDQTLTDALRTIASAAGLGFRVVQVGSTLEFQVFVPRDRTADGVMFSAALGNLRSLQTDPEAPTCTVALVGMQANDGASTVVEVVDPAAVARWWRMEQWVPSSASTGGTTDPAVQMQQDGRLALLSGAESVGLSAELVADPDQPFGPAGAFWLGDTVPVLLPDGNHVAEQVTSMKLAATPKTGAVWTPVIGTGDPLKATKTIDMIRDLTSRLGRVEWRW